MIAINQIRDEAIEIGKFIINACMHLGKDEACDVCVKVAEAAAKMYITEWRKEGEEV